MPSTSGLLTRKAQGTYHPGGSRMSEGLARARRPFRTKNAITATLISSFVLGVYFWSIRSVKQDDFSDVPLPSELERATTISIEDEQKQKDQLKKDWNDSLALGAAGSGEGVIGKSLTKAAPLPATSSRSVWTRLAGAFGGKGTESSLIVGAPPVDRVGTVGGVGATPSEMPERRLV
ncbi:hypothetical protein T439DRAFT_326983 [Meredithblackwellia eburnea MCA 4105]